MRRPVVICLAVAANLAALLAAGCASPPHFAKRVDIRPIPASVGAKLAAGAVRPTFYSAAVKAIEERDYGRALDLLQTARAQRADDVAVLNAFGVIYDKLGRFDLSARYYTQAKILDPDSDIIRRNVAYSNRLQGKWNADAQPQLLAANEQPLAPATGHETLISASQQLASAELPLSRARTVVPADVLARPPYAGFELAHAPVPVPLIRAATDGTLLMGQGLKIVDASGAPDRAELLRLRLMHKGWTAQKSQFTRVDARNVTTIVYPRQGAAIANALARTLGGPVRMSECGQTCGQVTLVLGKDRLAQTTGVRS